MSLADLRKQLISLAEVRSVPIVGVADLALALDAEPNCLELIPGEFSRAVVFGLPLQNTVLETIVDRPTPLYFHNYRQANYLLDGLALEAAAMIQSAGFRAMAIGTSQLIARHPMRGHVSHRFLGWTAGLGWWGRNNLLVNPDNGSRFRLVSVLTDADLEPDEPTERDCGRCVACVKVCPAGAIAGKRENFDLDKCYGKLCEFAKIPFVGQHICGVCVKACHPPNWPK